MSICGEEQSRLREQQLQRYREKAMLGALEDKHGGLCGCEK